jgi:hypothetical protein
MNLGTCTITCTPLSNPSLAQTCSVTVQDAEPPAVNLQNKRWGTFKEKTTFRLNLAGTSNVLTDVRIRGLAYLPSLNRVVFGYYGKSTVSGSTTYEAGYCYSDAPFEEFTSVPVLGNWNASGVVPRYIMSNDNFLIAQNTDVDSRMRSVYKSVDGISWTRVEQTLTSTTRIHDLARRGTGFMRCGDTPSTYFFQISSDGESWTTPTINTSQGGSVQQSLRCAYCVPSPGSTYLRSGTVIVVGRGSGYFITNDGGWSTTMQTYIYDASANLDYITYSPQDYGEFRIVGASPTANGQGTWAYCANPGSGNLTIVRDKAKMPQGSTGIGYGGTSSLYQVNRLLYHPIKEVYVLLAVTASNTDQGNVNEMYFNQAIYTTRASGYSSGGDYLANDKWTMRAIEGYINSLTSGTCAFPSRAHMQDIIYCSNLEKCVGVGYIVDNANFLTEPMGTDLYFWTEVGLAPYFAY